MLHAFFPHEHPHRPRVWRPPTDVYETEDSVVIQVEIAGVNSDELEISYSDRLLSIRGRREPPQERRSYYCLEISYGEFASDVLLPGAYVKDKIEAKYDNGFLFITLPKEKSHSIPVQTMQKE